jgi:hypothetical protein
MNSIKIVTVSQALIISSYKNLKQGVEMQCKYILQQTVLLDSIKLLPLTVKIYICLHIKYLYLLLIYERQ